MYNSKLDRVMYYMLLLGNGEFDLKDITYIFLEYMSCSYSFPMVSKSSTIMIPFSEKPTVLKDDPSPYRQRYAYVADVPWPVPCIPLSSTQEIG